MTSDRIVEEYRGYTLIAALHQGKFRGHARKNNELAFELEGVSVQDALKQLRNRIDAVYAKRIVLGAASPKAAAYAAAFKKIIQKMNDGQYAMLKAHFHAPNRCLSPMALAEAAGYKDIGGVGLWYGFLGQWIFEEMTDDISLDAIKGVPIYTTALASYISDPTNPAGHDVWKMHDEVATAIEGLGLAT